MGFFNLLWGWADYEPKNWSGPPSSVEEEPTRFVVRDHDGQQFSLSALADAQRAQGDTDGAIASMREVVANIEESR